MTNTYKCVHKLIHIYRKLLFSSDFSLNRCRNTITNTLNDLYGKLIQTVNTLFISDAVNSLSVFTQKFLTIFILQLLMKN